MKKRYIICITIVISGLLITAATFFKVTKNHTDRVILVTEKRITEAAKECVWNEDCKENKITLGYLIQKGYLKEEVNPITKMYYTHESYVLKENEQYTFHEV